MNMQTKCLILLSTVFLFADGSNILVFIPVFAKSHLNIYRPLIKELTVRGHNVTAVLSQPQSINSKNYKEIIVEQQTHDIPDDGFFIPKKSILPKLSKAYVFEMGYKTSDDGFRNPEFQNLIKTKPHFDLIINEVSFYQYSVVALGYILDAPMIGLSSHGLANEDDYLSDNPWLLPNIPEFSLPYSFDMTFFQRLHNTVFKINTGLENCLFNLPRHEELLKKHFGDYSLPPIVDMVKNVSLYIINSHYVFNPRPHSPNIIEVGGIHFINEDEDFSQEIQKYLDDSTDGLIYLSFGSIVPSHKFPNHVILAFIETFKKLKQRVFWKTNLDDIPGLPENIILRKWFPQRQILAHKNTLAFITHGGLLSWEESIWYGVPLIAVPFFGDQSHNAALIQAAGFGLNVDYFNISVESLNWALKEIIHNDRYRENMDRASKLFKDNPQRALDKAVWWVEHVIRHKGAPHLKPVGTNLPWFKYLLLDIFGFFIIVLVLIISLLYFSLKIVFSLIFRDSRVTEIKGNKKRN